MTLLNRAAEKGKMPDQEALVVNDFAPIDIVLD